MAVRNSTRTTNRTDTAHAPAEGCEPRQDINDLASLPVPRRLPELTVDPTVVRRRNVTRRRRYQK